MIRHLPSDLHDLVSFLTLQEGLSIHGCGLLITPENLQLESWTKYVPRSFP